MALDPLSVVSWGILSETGSSKKRRSKLFVSWGLLEGEPLSTATHHVGTWRNPFRRWWNMLSRYIS